MLGATHDFLFSKDWSRFEPLDLRVMVLDGHTRHRLNFLSPWISSYFISKGSVYPVLGDFEEKSTSLLCSLIILSMCAAFSVMTASFSTLVLASQSE